MEKSGRGILLGGLAIVSGVLIARRQVSLDTACNSDFQCRNCNRLSDCQLPEADKERKDG